jgi:single-strand DNA-binding protein
MLNLQAIGRLGKDAEVKEVNGKKMIEFSIATDQGYGDKKTTLWLNCSKWGENTAVAQYLVKGTQVHVAGEPSLNTYTNKEGKDVTTLRLSCQQITLCGGKSDQQQVTPAASESFKAETKLPDLDTDLAF